jgi:hypothetical protein
MRHLASLLAGMIAAPVAWLLIALGQEGFADARIPSGLAAPTAYVAAAGVLLGLIATLRISPLGPLVAGLLLLTVPVLLLVYGTRTLDAIPDTMWLFTRSFEVEPELPLVNGTLVLVGSALVMAVFSAKRWRRWPATAAPAAGQPAVEPAVEPAVARPAPEPVQLPVYAEPEPDYATSSAYLYPKPRDAESEIPAKTQVPAPRTARAAEPEPVYEPVLYEPPAVYRSRAAGGAGFAPAPLPPETRPVSAPPVSAPPVSAPPVSAPPVSAPPVSARPVSAPPVSAPPVTEMPSTPASEQAPSTIPVPIEPVYTVSEIERESEIAPTPRVPKSPPTSPWAAPPGQR